MAAADAQLYWMSAKVPNDQFLLFGFDGSPDRVDDAVAELRRRADPAASCGCGWSTTRRGVSRGGDPVLSDPTSSSSPTTPGTGRAASTRWHGSANSTPAEWRGAHVFAGVGGVPRVTGPGSVVVVQMSHALGDGSRSAVLAGALLGRAAPVPAAGAPDAGFCPGVR
jgi:hypothetical protein